MPAGAAARAPSYDWVSPEMFDEKLAEILRRVKGDSLLAIPGVYEVVSEHFNNKVLEELEAEREVPC